MPAPIYYCLVRIVLLIGAVSVAVPAYGQEDLFGQPAEEAIQAPAETESADPYARQLLSMANRGNREMGDAIASLVRTDRWTQVNRLLEGLDSQTPNAGSLLEIQNRIEPALFLEMKLSELISDKSRSALEKIAAATKQQRQSPERLRAAIIRLGDPSADRRLGAARILIEGGNASIAALVAAAVESDPPAERVAILRALLRQGPGGVAALKQLSLYGTTQSRLGAVESLALIDASTNHVDLLTALHAKSSTEQERTVASQYLGTVPGSLQSLSYAVDQLVAELEHKQRVADRIANDDQVITYWSVTADQSKVQFAKTRTIFAAYRDAADAAARLKRIGVSAPTVVTQSLIADLGYRLMIDSDWGDPNQIEEIRSSYGAEIDSSALLSSLSAAIEAQDGPATIGLLRMIQAASGENDSGDVLRGSGSARSPLVVAASSPIPRVRYEAALTASQIAGTDGYPGSSQVKRVLSEMMSLENLPVAVIVETRPEVIAPIQGAVAKLGLGSISVQNVSQLQQCLDRGGDIRLIITKTQLSDLPPIELIDVVRRTSRGRFLPIVMYGVNDVARSQLDPDLNAANARRWTGPTQWIETPTTISAYVGILDQIDRQRRLPPLSSIDRQRFRRESSDILKQFEPES